MTKWPWPRFKAFLLEGLSPERAEIVGKVLEATRDYLRQKYPTVGEVRVQGRDR